jgi:hypothetical protein
MVKMASERDGEPVRMREVARRLAGDESDEIRRVAAKLGFADEDEIWIQGAMGTVDEFRDTLIAMLAKRNNGGPIC